MRMASGPMGSHGCDTPVSLAFSMMQALEAQNTRFSIFTGDVVEGSTIRSGCRIVLLNTTQPQYGLSIKSAATLSKLYAVLDWPSGK